MAEFKVGDTVLNISTNKMGKIDLVHEAKRGLQLYRIWYSMEEIKDEDEDDLELVRESRDIFDACLVGAYRGYNDFQQYNTTFKINNSSNNTLSSIKASRTMFKPYQYIPLMKFLGGDIQRLLIADEVGLGKTIEAGHIMLELKSRGELRNVLVVCPKALSVKWQEEMFERFGLRFEIYVNKKAMIESIKAHNGEALGIITYEGISDLRSLADNKQDKSADDEKKEKSVLKFIEDNNVKYSLVVCDEAHRVRNTNTSRRESIARLLTMTDSVVFLTATPIMLGRENLFSLLNLLNSQRYAFKSAFEDEMEHVKPFVWGIRALNANASFEQIRKGLDEIIPEDDYTRNNLERYKHLMQLLQEEDTPRTRALVQSDLYDINPLSTIMSRTRKVDVATELSQATRDVQTTPVILTEDEQVAFDSYMVGLKDVGPLSRSTKRRQLASSVYAFLRGACHIYREDAKYNKLLEIISASINKGSKKVIVFASFKETIRYLGNRLVKDKIEFRAISGDDKTREERIRKVNDFRDKEDVIVLLSTEVGGEGLDMQFCDTMVNYDLPWNPMVVEQRIGRIDRIGQKAKVIHIYNMIVNGSIQHEIHERLLRRIEVFRETIGDLEPILCGPCDGQTVKEAIEELYRTELTKEELGEKIRRINQAIERNMEDSRRLERELSDSFTSDAYLRNQLNTILNKRAYVTEEELENYVRCLFRLMLPTCSISATENGIARISIPRNDSKAITNFLYKYSGIPGETGVVMREYINSIRDMLQLKVTFRQDVAEHDRSIAFLNIYHPFVMAAKESFRENDKSNMGLFRFRLPHTILEGAAPGYYTMVIYNICTETERYGSHRIMNDMYSVVYDIQKRDIIEEEIISNAFYRAIQIDGTSWCTEDSCTLERDIVNDMRVCMNAAARGYCKTMKDEAVMRQHDDIEHQRQAQNKRYNFLIEQQRQFVATTEERIAECKQQISEGKGQDICSWEVMDDKRPWGKKRSYEKAKEELERVLPAQRGRLNSVIDEFNKRSEQLDSIPEPQVTPNIMMLNLIHVV